jgi:hypothetical protein
VKEFYERVLRKYNNAPQINDVVAMKYPGNHDQTLPFPLD